MIVKGYSFVASKRIPANVSFGNGEVKLWTDFDGTLFPSNSSALQNETVVSKLKNYFERITQFFQGSNGKAECNVTTGRNFVSFYKIYNQLKKLV